MQIETESNNVLHTALNCRAVSYTHLDVYKRQVVYVSDHSTVVKAEAISRKK